VLYWLASLQNRRSACTGGDDLLKGQAILVGIVGKPAAEPGPSRSRFRLPPGRTRAGWIGIDLDLARTFDGTIGLLAGDNKHEILAESVQAGALFEPGSIAAHPWQHER